MQIVRTVAKQSKWRLQKSSFQEFAKTIQYII